MKDLIISLFGDYVPVTSVVDGVDGVGSGVGSGVGAGAAAGAGVGSALCAGVSEGKNFRSCSIMPTAEISMMTSRAARNRRTYFMGIVPLSAECPRPTGGGRVFRGLDQR